MTKTFKGPDRFKAEMEWERGHPEYKVVQFECHDSKVTVYYTDKDEEVIDDA